MSQEDSARQKFIEGQGNAVELKSALIDLNSFLIHTFQSSLSEVEIWGNGATMDISMVDYAADKTKVLIRWNHRMYRDVRTLVSLAPHIKDETAFEGVKHYGIDDCKHQVRYCHKTHNYIMNFSDRLVVDSGTEEELLP